MFAATESGYTEFQSELMRRVVTSLVEDVVESDRLTETRLESYVSQDLAELFWDRIPEEHYHFIASVADTPSFYAGDDVDLTHSTADLIEQIAFSLVVADTMDEFTTARDDFSRDIERVRLVLDIHDTLDKLEAHSEAFESLSDIVDAFFTWCGEQEYGLSLREFNEAHIRRLESVNAFDPDVVYALDTWLSDGVN